MPVLFAFIFVLFAAAACINDLTPQGGWSNPIIEDGKLFVGNLDGNLVKFDPETANLDLGWRYPREDGLGAIYGSPIIVGDNIYGAGYTCRGDNCNGEIYGRNLVDGSSMWGRRGRGEQTKLVGGNSGGGPPDQAGGTGHGLGSWWAWRAGLPRTMAPMWRLGTGLAV